MKTAARASLLGFAAWSLAACVPATDPARPIIESSIVTPSGPEYRYSFVMVHHGYDWWVQIGPKLDADGTHVAIQGWISCETGLTTAPTCASYDFFQEYQTLTAGSVHDYAITWTSGGWALSCDGQVLATLNPGSSDPITEIGSELTTS